MICLRLALLLTSALSVFAALPVFANPLGPDIKAGNVSVEGVGTATVDVNQSSTKAIIDWRSFNIDPSESTTFHQPSTDAVILNRVTGGEGPSQILGTLRADGQVFLVNPDGILFRRDATVDVGALVATTHDLFDGDFLSGSYEFGLSGNPKASVVNLGTITVKDSGFAALVAPGVRNAGTITARLGKVSLASSSSFSLDLYGDSLVTLGLSDDLADQVIDLSTGKPLRALVDNDGSILAGGGLVQLTAAATRRIIDSVVNTTGTIEADTVGMKNGRIVLSAATARSKPAGSPAQTVSVSGTLSASGKSSGETGGTVEITGEELALAEATIDAFGWKGGGSVLVGGDTSGGGTLARATTTSIDAASLIDASAMSDGNGGKVVVWSDGDTTFDGAIIARGGADSGDGGFAETSGHQALDFNGVVDTSAPLGVDGTLLLDPLTVTIGTTGSHTITPAALAAQLVSNNVKVSTGSTGSEAGDITVAEAVNWNSTNSLMLSAARNIAVNAAISNSAGADVTLRADDQGTGIGTVSFGTSGHVTTTGAVSAYYNPSSYTLPDVLMAPHVTAASFTAYMLVNDLAQLQSVSTNLAGNYALGRDIEASDTANWNAGYGFVPIGYFNSFTTSSTVLPISGYNATPTPFTGAFDGQGFAIKHLYLTNPSDQNAGLFSDIGSTGVVRNLAIEDATVTFGANNHNAGLLAGINFGSVDKVSATGTLTVGAGAMRVGGLVGWDWNGSITDSHTDVTIVGSTGNTDIGGLLGAGGFAGSGTITHSYALGNVTLGDNAGSTGGLVGSNNGSQIFNSYATGAIVVGANSGAIGGLVGGSSGYWAAGLISGSYATGDVTSGVGSSSTGGLAGTSIWYGTISNSYASGDVIGDVAVGGLVGWNGYGDLNQPYGATIVTSYATGHVSGGTYVGGLVGFENAGSISTSYWDTQTSGTNTGLAGVANGGTASIVGYTTAQLVAALPTGLSTTTWARDPNYNGGYPYLLWQRQTPTATPVTVLTPTAAGTNVSSPKVTTPNDTTADKQIASIGTENSGSSGGSTDRSTPAPNFTTLDGRDIYVAPPILASGQHLVDTALWTGTDEPLTSSALLERLSGFQVASANAYATGAGTDWTTLVADLGYSDALVNELSKLGFGATLSLVDGRHVLAFEGTQDWQDWKLDISNALHGTLEREGIDISPFPPTEKYAQYAFAAKLVADLMNTYPDLVLTGHSLGGGMAAYAGAKNGVPAITYNPAGFNSSSISGLNTSMVLNLQVEDDFAQAGGALLGNVVVFDKAPLEVSYKEHLSAQSAGGTLIVNNGPPRAVDAIAAKIAWMHDLSRFTELKLNGPLSVGEGLTVAQGLQST